MHLSLTNFCRENIKEIPQPDVAEKIGDFGWGLLRLGFGKTVKISRAEHPGVKLDWHETQFSTFYRVVAKVLAVVLFPITAVLAGIGWAGYTWSKTRLDAVQEYDKVKALAAQLLKIDLSKETGLDKVCELVPGYDPEIDIKAVEVSQQIADAVKVKFEKVLHEQVEFLDSKKLRGLKTYYLKIRDILKEVKYKGSGIPDPSTTLPLLSQKELFAELDAILPESMQDVNKDPVDVPVSKFPDYLYRYDHPRDSGEGLTSLGMIFGGMRKPSPHWKNALEYAEKEVLPFPLKERKSQELLQILKELHTKIAGTEDGLRDKYMLVADPAKCALSSDSIKNYLQQQPEGDKLVKRNMRLTQKIMRWGSMEKAASYITPKQWNALQQAVYCPSSPVDLENKVIKFLDKLQILMNENVYHPIQIAAFIHYGLTTLHLFKDANGRLARLFTNIYLMQQGYEPFYVVNDSVYTQLYHTQKYDLEFYNYLLKTWKDIQSIEEDAKNHPEGSAEVPECVMQ